MSKWEEANALVEQIQSLVKDLGEAREYGDTETKNLQGRIAKYCDNLKACVNTW